MNQTAYGGYTAFNAPMDARMDFIRKTYAHLTGAIFAFIALSVVFFQVGIGEAFARWVSTSGRFGWMMVLVAFMLAGYLASALAKPSQSVSIQYLGLAIETIAWAFIFSPAIFIAAIQAPGALPTAALLTLIVFGTLSIYVFTTRKDFSFLAPALLIGGVAAIAIIVGGATFGFSLGLWFSVAMVLFAIGAVLYSTSNVLHKYAPGQHVGAALELFGAIALLFWYILRIVMAARR